jgi:tetratricopeptide (TPR) repeat protein
MSPFPTPRFLLFLLLAAVADVLMADGSLPAPVGETAKEVAAPAPTPPPAELQAGPRKPLDQREEEYAGLLRLSEKKLAAKDAESAIAAARQALRMAKGDEAAAALLHLARAYRVAGEGVKASATYEHLLRDHPGWHGVPLAMIELGRTLRELGAPRLAIARFYSVIQSTLRLPEADTEDYRRLVRTAQFEIAETHFAAGDTTEAIRFFKRLDALDLAPADRARARFRTAQAELLAGERAAAVNTLERLLVRDGGAAEAAEARFLLARVHAEDGRNEAALRVTLELLRATNSTADPAIWREWQLRAGHFLARRFQQSAEPHSALLLYRALALLDQGPDSRANTLYEIGRCLEELRLPDEARAAYGELAGLLEKAPKENVIAHELLLQARWRSRQLEWTGNAENQIRRLRGEAGADSLPRAPQS